MTKGVVPFLMLLSAACIASAGPYSSLVSNLKGLSGKALLKAVASDRALKSDTELQHLARTGNITKLTNYLNGRASLEHLQATGQPQAQSIAHSIVASPLYAREQNPTTKNWLLSSISNLIDHIKLPSPVHTSSPSFLPPSTMQVVVVLVWCLLGAAVLAFAVFAALRFSAISNAKKRHGGIVDEQEPDRTVDEWLHLAADHEQKGDIRHAVRALYLACLITFDHLNIAQFDRSETNWQHLARIEKSARKLENVSFREPTAIFDRVWYGYQNNGLDDVRAMRATFDQIQAGKALKGVA